MPPRVASLDEQEQVSVLLNRRMIEMFKDPQARSWYKMFNHMDGDSSGTINFYELQAMIRQELKMTVGQLSDEQLKAVWLALDEDNSGLITVGEFGRFMRIGAHVHEKPPEWKERVRKANLASGAAVRSELKGLLQSSREEERAENYALKAKKEQIRTAEAAGPATAIEKHRRHNEQKASELRRERDERLLRHLLRVPEGASGPRIASEEEQTEISIMLNQRMKELIADPQARSWYKLFIHMDGDGSGKIDYYELLCMVRGELKLPPSRLTDEQLQAIWRSIDTDKSGRITSGEFGKFMRLGEERIEEPGRDRLLKMKRAEGEAAREAKRQLLAELSQCSGADQAAKRAHAAELHDVLWGLRPKPADPERAWHGPRALML